MAFSGPSTLPSAISTSKPTDPDASYPIFDTTPPDAMEAGPSSYYDYTENAPQADVDAVAIQRAKEGIEGPADMMVGSLPNWTGVEDGKL